MTAPVITKRKPWSDLIKSIYDGYYCIERRLFQNASGATSGSALTVNSIYPIPVRAGSAAGSVIPVLAGNESACTGIMMYDKTISALSYFGTIIDVPVLTRGPSILDSDAFPVLDVGGGTLTKATIITALAGLSPPIICKAGPTATTQTDMGGDLNA